MGEMKVEIKKSRGRKSNKNVEVVKKYSINNKMKSKAVETIILQLPFRTEDLFKESITINPYDEDDNYQTLKKSDKTTIQEKEKLENGIIMQDSILKDDGYIQKKLLTLQIEFIDGNKYKELPHSTSIACRYCCHTFENTPVGVPVRYLNNIFYLDGIYCSFNCAASSIFEKTTPDQWEKYNLLNLMYKKVSGNDKIVKIPLAPVKESLEIFGGPLSIKEFRKNSFKNERQYNLVAPPMISLVPKLEENLISFNVDPDQTFVPINQHLVQKAQNNILSQKVNIKQSGFSDFWGSRSNSDSES